MTDEFKVPCYWGYCSHYVNPKTNKIGWGFGPMDCPCDHSKGWKSVYVEGQAKPHVPIKAKGRHGSKRQRAIKRHSQLPDYRGFINYLPGKSRY